MAPGNLLPPAAAKDYFDRHMVFAISLREIAKTEMVYFKVKLIAIIFTLLCF
jgi:hypothetical protein